MPVRQSSILLCRREEILASGRTALYDALSQSSASVLGSISMGANGIRALASRQYAFP